MSLSSTVLGLPIGPGANETVIDLHRGVPESGLTSPPLRLPPVLPLPTSTVFLQGLEKAVVTVGVDALIDFTKTAGLPRRLRYFDSRHIY
jgi:hypothetical protein